MHFVQDIDDLQKILQNNPGKVILKFTAKWCNPCKKIENHVQQWVDKLPNTIQTVIVDIDDCRDVYAFYKSKKMLSGVPTLLMYQQNNLDYTFDDSVCGSDQVQYDLFFNRIVRN